MYEATSLKNIKYKTLPYNISNHSIYKFIFKKKKSRRYSNSTQFKFFFSSLKNPKGVPGARDTLWYNTAIREAPGECDSMSRVPLARTFECEDTMTVFF